jgi:hypothetical protein
VLPAPVAENKTPWAAAVAVAVADKVAPAPVIGSAASAAPAATATTAAAPLIEYFMCSLPVLSPTPVSP